LAIGLKEVVKGSAVLNSLVFHTVVHSSGSTHRMACGYNFFCIDVSISAKAEFILQEISLTDFFDKSSHLITPSLSLLQQRLHSKVIL
jgi:hypothetical protein